ncbi:hematopoietic prostaglandin D synthase-like [Clavelina lepadiformis]|uniref:glutathione transferase n=1 Tax=Clavelina lepadiformis TaxID=159417 RepID=A0ABP0GFG1_CLALP
MPKYKLYYFPLKGRGEIIRLLFAYANVEYEDVRIPFDEWPTKKNDFPFKQLPVLDVDGKRYSQSHAIERFLAREFSLVGKNSSTLAKADEFGEAMQDVMMKLPWTEKDEETKERLMKQALTETIPPALEIIENNFTNGDYYAGELTFTDIGFASCADHLLSLDSSVLDGTPKLKALFERIWAIPSIASWVKKRPKTAM